MSSIITKPTLSDQFWAAEGSALWVKRALLVVAGVVMLTICAKVKFHIPGSPVPVTLGTFGVLAVGAAYGLRMGLVTILAYLAIGAMGVSVFAGSSAEKAGLVYMMGGTGGYLVGYVLATGALGVLAQRGWDRSVIWMAVAMIVGNVLIYVPGLLWLNTFAESWSQTFAWGITPFMVGDALKLALAALLLPALWKFVGNARG
jgi:biotin transport system substrate-specific component